METSPRARTFRHIFFHNIGVKQTIFKNTFWLTAAEAVSRLIQFFIVIYITRVLGAAEFGKFSFALAFVSLLVVFSNFGLSNIATREFSKGGEEEKDFPAVLSLKVILSAVVLSAMLAGSWLVTDDASVRKIIWILAFFTLTNDFFSVIYAFLRARQRMEYEAWAKIGQAFLTAAAVLLVLAHAPSVENISWAHVAASVIALAAVAAAFYFQAYPLRFAWDPPVWRKFFSLSWLLGLATVCGAAFVNLDSVMLGYFGQVTQLGWYSAAKQIVIACAIPPAMIMASFFPILSRFFKESPDKLHKAWIYYMELMIILAVPLAAGGIALAPKIIPFLYGSGYEPSVAAFQILIIVAALICLYNPLYILLVVANQQRKVFFVTLAGICANVVLNYILIYRFGLYGAAISLVATHGIVVMLFMRHAHFIVPLHSFKDSLAKTAGIALCAALLMLMVLLQPFIYSLHIIVSIIIGALVYGGAMYAGYAPMGRFFRQAFKGLGNN